MKTAKYGPHAGESFRILSAEAERFWRHVPERGDGCWEWRGAVNRGGYGTMSILRVRLGPMAAHRVSYAIANGRAPKGLVVMHTCDNTRCVNPQHLVAGSQGDNTRDAIRKGRLSFGGGVLFCVDCGAATGERTALGDSKRGRCSGCTQLRSVFFSSLRRERLIKRSLHRLTFVPPSRLADLAAAVGARAAEMFARNYGLYDFPAENLTQVGARFGVTRERVRQLVGVTCRTFGGEAITAISSPRQAA